MIKVDWFSESQINNNRNRATIIEVEEIMQEALYHPQRAKRMMMEQIDIALDNWDSEEFYALSNILLTMP